MSAIVVHPPTAPATPVLVAVGHAGRLLPPGMAQQLRCDPQRLRQLEDPWVDRLVATVPATGATLLVTGWSRAVADVNRAPDELDPAGLADPDTGRWRATSKARAGLGVVPTEIAGEPLYRRPLASAIVRGRLDLAHAPYHRALVEQLTALRRRFGRVLLLDLHSMPETALTGVAGPIDVALGDRFGRATDARWLHLVDAYFRDVGLAVGHNHPYAGGYVVEAHGQPALGHHALQIEIRRRLYMDEATLAPHDGLAWVGRLCHDLVQRLGTALRDGEAGSLAVAGE